MLEREEIARLEADLPRLSEWGAALLVPFRARRLRAASVVWLNERWFLERQVDVTDPMTRARACAWLLDGFAFGVPDSADSGEAYLDDEKVFHADRYGGSGIVPHGGSGRAGLAGCFQTKGIGITPLVGDVSSWTYSHGCAWLEEALREAIYAEIAAAEFPHGALPVVAVLDTGINYRMPDGKLGERRALVVRPAAVRPAHLERAPMFAGGSGERQERDTNDRSDVQRVKDAVRMFDGSAASGQTPGVRVSGWMDLFTRVAEQVGFGQVHRLCHGGYLTSNLTLNAELLDFGSFRSVPDWARTFPLDNMPGFGDELLLLDSAIRSLSFFHGKYKLPGSPALSRPQILQAVSRALAARFDLECLRVWNIVDVVDADLRGAVIGAMREYFAAQQRLHVRYQLGLQSAQAWMGDALLSGELPESETRDDHLLTHRILTRIENAIAAHFGESGRPRRELARLTAARLLKPRPSLYRERLQAWLYDRLGGQNSTATPDPDSLSDAVRTCLSNGRRHWPRLGANLAVFSQVSWGHSSALVCRDVATSEWCLWAEGVVSRERVRLFDRWVPVDSLRAFRAAADEGCWTGLFPVSRGPDGWFDLSIPSAHFALPPRADWSPIIDPDAASEGAP